MRRALLLALVLAACREEATQMPDPIPMSRDALSYYCQMNIIDHAGPKGQIHLEGQSTPLFFAQVRDAIAYLKAPEREARITAVYVSDMGNAPNWKDPGDRNWTDARTATFVVGAGVRGGMGAPEIVPFAKPEDADAFIDRYGGKAMTIDEIPDDAVLAPVDLNTPLETPS